MAKYIRRAVILIIIILGILVAFQLKNYQKKEKCRDNAMMYFEEHDYKKAIDYLEEGKKNMTIFGRELDLDMNCYLAECYYQLGEYNTSIKVCNELMDLNENNPMIYLLKAENYQALDDMKSVIATYESGWENTKSTEFLQKICDSYMKNGDFDQALEYAEKGVDSGSKDAAEFLFKKIVIYEKANDYESACKSAEKYVELYPEDEKGIKELKFLTTRVPVKN